MKKREAERGGAGGGGFNIASAAGQTAGQALASARHGISAAGEYIREAVDSIPLMSAGLWVAFHGDPS